jgi:hypothetical protein
MLSNKALLKQQATDTAEILALKVRELETRISPLENTKAHPLPMVGIAVVAGFASTYWLRGLWKPAGKFLAEEFSEELKLVKKAGMDIALNLLTKKLQS